MSYYLTGSGAEVYHTEPNCEKLRSEPEKVSRQRVESKELPPCSFCDGERIIPETYGTKDCPMCGEPVSQIPTHLRKGCPENNR